MVREVISETASQPPAVQGKSSETPPQMVEPPSDSRRDALAEAFPAWDLLPAVAFVRRVK